MRKILMIAMLIAILAVASVDVFALGCPQNKVVSYQNKDINNLNNNFECVGAKEIAGEEYLVYKQTDPTKIFTGEVVSATPDPTTQRIGLTLFIAPENGEIKYFFSESPYQSHAFALFATP